MDNNKETLLDDGIEEYGKYAYERIFALEYGLKNLLEAVIEEANDIPKFKVYIVVSIPNGQSILYKKSEEDKECINEMQFYIDAKSLLQSDGQDLEKISEMLKLDKEDLFILPLHLKQKDIVYQIRLVIYTEDYSKYIGLKYIYERFAFESKEILSLKNYSPFFRNDKLVSDSIKLIYTEFGYRNEKCIPSFSIITKLSAMTYESNKCNARIICTHEVKNLDIELFKPELLDANNLRAVRKLLEVANDNLSLIISWRTKEGSPFPVFEAVGFAKGEDYQKCVQFEILGYLHWRLLDGKELILNYRQGRYVVVKKVEFNTKHFTQCLQKVFGKNTEYEKIIQIVVEAQKQLHGTTLIIASDARNEVLRLCNNNRGYQIKEIELDKQLSLVKNLTSIDGAVMMDEYGKCFGIGVILDGECIVRGNQARGARYNSAYNYIAIMRKNKKSAIAVIISEDRTMDIIASCDDFTEM